MKPLIILIIFIIFTLNSCNIAIVNKEKAIEAILIQCEKAYFEGQKDAINGDIRIKFNSDSCYIWTKSPWDNGTMPTYNPTYLDSKK